MNWMIIVLGTCLSALGAIAIWIGQPSAIDHEGNRLAQLLGCVVFGLGIYVIVEYGIMILPRQ